jgi:hypothetical protein
MPVGVGGGDARRPGVEASGMLNAGLGDDQSSILVPKIVLAEKYRHQFSFSSSSTFLWYVSMSGYSSTPQLKIDSSAERELHRISHLPPALVRLVHLRPQEIPFLFGELMPRFSKAMPQNL